MVLPCMLRRSLSSMSPRKGHSEPKPYVPPYCPAHSPPSHSFWASCQGWGGLPGPRLHPDPQKGAGWGSCSPGSREPQNPGPIGHKHLLASEGLTSPPHGGPHPECPSIPLYRAVGSIRTAPVWPYSPKAWKRPPKGRAVRAKRSSGQSRCWECGDVPFPPGWPCQAVAAAAELKSQQDSHLYPLPSTSGPKPKHFLEPSGQLALSLPCPSLPHAHPAAASMLQHARLPPAASSGPRPLHSEPCALNGSSPVAATASPCLLFLS